MGKQINFYMTNSDEEEFLNFVRSDRSVGVFMVTMPTDSIPLLTELPQSEIPFWLSICLWDRDNSPQPNLRYVTEQKYYVVNKSTSEVIEFLRSNIKKRSISRGRIWAEMAMWESDGTLVRKSETFEKWYDRLARWIRRHSVRYDKGVYVMPGAAEFKKQGGRLVE